MSPDIDELYEPILPFSAWLDAAPPEFALYDAAEKELRLALDSVDAETAAKAIDAAFDAAALETGSIEGLYPSSTGVTISVIEGVQSLDDVLAEMSDSNAPRLVSGQRGAYALARDVVGSDQPLTEVLVRRIHEDACFGQQTYKVHTDVGPQDQALPKGEYKMHPNHVRQSNGTWHAYAPVREVAPEMARLIEESRSSSWSTASPVLRSAYLHHGITHIHPFADGNGRVARVLASIPIVAATGSPLVVFEDRKARYWDAQAQADLGNVRPFVAFMEQSISDVLSLVTLRIHALRPGQSHIDEELDEALGRYGPRSERNVAAAQRLHSVLLTELYAQQRSLESTGALRFTWQADRADPIVHSGFIGFAGPEVVTMSTAAEPPISARTSLSVGVASDDADLHPVAVMSSTGLLPVRLDEIMPIPTQILVAKVREWVALEVSEMKKRLAAQLRR